MEELQAMNWKSKCYYLLDAQVASGAEGKGEKRRRRLGMFISTVKKRKVLERPERLEALFDASSTAAFTIPTADDDAKVIQLNADEMRPVIDIVDFDSYPLGDCDFGDVSKFSKNAASCKEAGCQLAESGRMSEAVTKWQEGLLFSPGDHILHELTAQGFLFLDRNLPALRSAERAVELCPLWTEGLLTLARAQRELGELEASLETYQRIIEIDSVHKEAALEVKSLTPLLASLAKRREELLQKVEASVSPDEIEANTCILNLCSRAQVG
jgi:tetratricopeptide (TPR) repeat protein